MLCARCQCPIDDVPRPTSKHGGKAAYFDWALLKDLRPGSSDSILVPIGNYASAKGVYAAGNRYSRDLGIKVRASIKTTGVRFWRLA